MSVTEKLHEARKELLDFSLRNPLVNFRRLKAKGIEVVDEIPKEIFRILVLEGKAMSFLPAPDGEADEGDELFEQPEDDSGNGVAARHVDSKLQTSHSSAKLQKRLLNTFYTARTHMEERGVNVLFLALGMLEWYESESTEKKRRAPLVLIPVELYRSSAQTRFKLSFTEEDIGGNLSLQAKLKTEFGIDLPIVETTYDQFEIDAYFDDICKSIEHMRRWMVDRKAIELGFFSFGKFLMYNDLDVKRWPKSVSPEDHPVFESLFGEGFPQAEGRLEETAHLDDHLDPKQVYQVMDADSTQTLAILDAVKGNNLVIQGPPGTGKSQTITNLIAEALAQGRKVLFVSEKMAALEVVKRRLDAIGIGDACLELHSHKTKKKAVLEEIARTLRLGRPNHVNFEDKYETLIDARDRLNAYSTAINTPVGESGVTPQQAFGHLVRLQRLQEQENIRFPLLECEEMQFWTSAQFSRRRALVEQVQALVAQMGLPKEHPFWGVQLARFLPTEKPAIIDSAERAKAATRHLQSVAKALASDLLLPEPLGPVEAGVLCRAARRALEAPEFQDVNLRPAEWAARRRQVEALLRDGEKYRQIHLKYDAQLIPEVWTQDVLAIRQHLAAHGKKWWRFLIGDFRRAKSELAGYCAQPLPKEYDARLAIVEAVMEAQRLSKAIQAHDEVGGFLFGTQWQGVDSDWAVLSQITRWVEKLHQDIEHGELPRGLIDFLVGGPDLEKLEPEVTEVEQALRAHEPVAAEIANRLKLNTEVRFEDGKPLSEQSFDAQVALYEAVISNTDRLHDMVSYRHKSRTMQEEEMAFFLPVAENWSHASSRLTDAFRFNWYNQLVVRAMRERPALARFDGAGHNSTAETFCRLDAETFQVNRVRLALKHWRQLPRNSAFGQMSLLRHEMQRRRGHLPIRRLIEKAGNAIQAIKPVFMMSPMSIAMYLPPGSISFEMVIFDEASQVKPVDAFGAILRAKQAVVVGDSKQLPPTSFFESMVAEEDEDEEDEVTMRPGDVESVLALFASKNAPERMLRWHYRSRHDSLIAVSNREFYDSRLIAFPSPDKERASLGLRFHYLPDTYYDRGGSRANKGEARAVAETVMQHARENPQWTLGVAAFSQAQAEAVLNQLELLRRKDPSCESFFNGHPEEPFFVKNLENVQGDERDVIYISVGYGRDANGKLTMNFGPLNRDGGERRLNVLITRARRRCEVFSNIRADDIDLGRTNARGVVALKRYLHYAETGELEMPEFTGRGADSVFEEAVADAIRKHGYTVHHQVGSAGYYIDLAVVDPDAPGRYLLGIECDGASYHSARSARDRDRIRQAVLEGLGWRFHRIWSTDWFRNPERELGKVIESIEAARVHVPVDQPERPEVEIITRAEETPTGIEREELEDAFDVEQELSVPYKPADLPSKVCPIEGLHEEPVLDLADLLREVVEIESPVHFEEAARRILDAYGISRLGNRIRDHLEEAVEWAEIQNWIRREGAFLFAPEQTNVPVRDRRTMKSRSRKLKFIAPVEIQAAIERVVRHSHGITAEEALAATCTLLGFQRTTTDMREKVQEQLEVLLEKNRIVNQSGVLMVS